MMSSASKVRTLLPHTSLAAWLRHPDRARAFLVFGIAIALRLAILYYNAAAGSGHYLLQDSSSYYRIAVNLATGHGYVLERGQEPYFLREPAAIYLFAASASLYQLVTRHTLTEPSYDANNWPRDRDNQRVILLIRLVQAVIQAAALALFLLLLQQMFDPVFAFVVAVFASVYPPLALFNQQLMRENLLLGVLVFAAYLLSSHRRRPSHWKAAAIGVSWGIAALSLQVYSLLGLFLLPSLLRGSAHLLVALKRAGAMVALFVLTVLPWLHEVYAVVPDVRIAASMGSALTFDWTDLQQSLTYARSHLQRTSGTSPQAPDPLLATDMYAFTCRQCFENTFNGSFRRMARYLDLRYGRPSAGERLQDYAGMLSNFLFLPGYHYEDWSASRSVPPHDHGNMIFIMFMSFVLGACSLIGLVICCRRAVDVTLVYLFHLAFFWILMSATRRAIPIVPFFVLFGVVGFSKILQLGFPRCRFAIFKDG